MDESWIKEMDLYRSPDQRLNLEKNVQQLQIPLLIDQMSIFKL